MESDEQEEILRMHGDSVWRLIVRILGNDGPDAADCFQQSFSEFYSRQFRSNDVRNAGALLRRIGTARAIDVVRLRIRDRARTSASQADRMASPRKFEPEVQASEQELLDDLRAALASLPVQQAIAFVLTQIEELSNESAANSIGVTVGNLGVLLHRARTALQMRLQSHNPLPETLP